MIHRAITGSIERFLGHPDREHRRRLPAVARAGAGAGAAGRRPPRRLRRVGAGAAARRTACGSRSTRARESVGRRIRDGELAKIPYLLIVGDKEAGGRDGVRPRPPRGRPGTPMALDALAARAAPPRREAGVTVRINWVGVRNFLIIAAIAGLVFVSQEGFGATAVSARADHPGAVRRRPDRLRLQLLPPERAGLARPEAVAAVRDHRLRHRHRVPADRRLPAAGRPPHARSA